MHRLQIEKVTVIQRSEMSNAIAVICDYWSCKKRLLVTEMMNITLDYSDKCFKKLQLLYIVSPYMRYQTDEFLADV